jgi:hypothetical protein
MRRAFNIKAVSSTGLISVKMTVSVEAENGARSSDEMSRIKRHLADALMQATSNSMGISISTMRVKDGA